MKVQRAYENRSDRIFVLIIAVTGMAVAAAEAEAVTAALVTAAAVA